MSSLRSARALPNDYWTAETVEDYMRCKVAEVFGRKILFLHSHGFSGDQLPDWSFKPFGAARSLQDLDSFKESGGEGGLRLTHSLESKNVVGQS